MQCQNDKFFPNEISLVRVARTSSRCSVLAEPGGRGVGGTAGEWGLESFCSFYGLPIQESSPASLWVALVVTCQAPFCLRPR